MRTPWDVKDPAGTPAIATYSSPRPTRRARSRARGRELLHWPPPGPGRDHRRAMTLRDEEPRTARSRGPVPGGPGRECRGDRRVAARDPATPRRHRRPRHVRSRRDLRPVRARRAASTDGRALGRRRSSTYGAAPDVRDALVIGISQSGASPDIVAVIAEARHRAPPRSPSPTSRSRRWRPPPTRRSPSGPGRNGRSPRPRPTPPSCSRSPCCRPPWPTTQPTVPSSPPSPTCSARALDLEPRDRVDRTAPGGRDSRARHRPRVRVRDRPRMGTQAQGIGPGLRRSLLLGRFPTRAADPRRARRAGARRRPGGRAGRRPRDAPWPAQDGPRRRADQRFPGPPAGAGPRDLAGPSTGRGPGVARTESSRSWRGSSTLFTSRARAASIPNYRATSARSPARPEFTGSMTSTIAVTSPNSVEPVTSICPSTPVAPARTASQWTGTELIEPSAVVSTRTSSESRGRCPTRTVA